MGKKPTNAGRKTREFLFIQYGNMIGLSKFWRVTNNKNQLGWMNIWCVYVYLCISITITYTSSHWVLLSINGRKTRITHNENDVMSIKHQYTHTWWARSHIWNCDGGARLWSVSASDVQMWNRSPWKWLCAKNANREREREKDKKKNVMAIEDGMFKHLLVIIDTSAVITITSAGN